MSAFRRFSLVFIVLFLIACTGPGYVTRSNPREQYVVMLSMDGCRWDSPQLAHMPNLDRIARAGVKAASLQPVFPSKTFPNHYSIATGLYADHHGIVQNAFYDPEMQKAYRISDRTAVENPAFYGGEPIWVTAEKQGVRTASYFWVGSEAAIKGVQPSIWKRYDHNFPFAARADSVIAWLQLPASQRPHLITWYFSEPDGTSHRFGPTSPETRAELTYLDSLVGDFLDKLARLPIADQVNVIVTADHGMADISPDRVVLLDKIFDPAWIKMVQGSNPVWLLDLEDTYVDSALSLLDATPHIRAWRAGEVPEYLHYGNNPRVPDIVVAADTRWSALWSQELEGGHFGSGTHGYDPVSKDMHAIFYAMGPAFKPGYIQPTFENIDIYPLIAHILHLDPAPVDGNLENVRGMLRSP